MYRKRKVDCIPKVRCIKEVDGLYTISGVYTGRGACCIPEVVCIQAEGWGVYVKREEALSSLQFPGERS